MWFLILFFVFVGSHLVHSGYIFESGIGTECLYDEDCITRNSFCKGNKICACKIGYQYDQGSDVCFPKEVDLKCNEDYDCSALQNARCTSGRCQCKIDYVPSKDKSYCLPSMRLTSICEEDSQCNSVMNQSYCDRRMRRCVCDKGLKQDMYRMRCVEEKILHKKCVFDVDCEDGDPKNKEIFYCKVPELTCECAVGYIEKNDFCYKDGSSIVGLSTSTLIAMFLVKWLA